MSEFSVKPVERVVAKESDPRSKRAYLFVSGATGANHGLVHMDRAFREVTSSQHVLVMNSVMSMDRHNPERYQEQAQFIISNLQAGRDVEVVSASLGTVEVMRTLKLIREQNPTFFDDPEIAKRLTLVHNGTAGFDPLIQRFNFLINYIALAFSKNRAVNAGTAFPPQNISPEQHAENTRWLLKSKKPQEKMVPFEDTDKNYNKLPEDIKAQVAAADTRIKDLIEKGRRRSAKRAWKRRGGILKDELQRVFDGDYVDNNTLPKAPAVSWIELLLKRPPVRGALIDLVFREIVDSTKDLVEKGVKTRVVPFEHDSLVSRRSVRRFIRKTSSLNNNGEILYIENFGHAGLVLQAKLFADAVTRRREDSPVL